VYRAKDDGSPTRVFPTGVLEKPADSGFGVFYGVRDARDRLWVSSRPYLGKGYLFTSENGEEWEIKAVKKQLTLDQWKAEGRSWCWGSTVFRGVKHSGIVFMVDGSDCVDFRFL